MYVSVPSTDSTEAYSNIYFGISFLLISLQADFCGYYNKCAHPSGHHCSPTCEYFENKAPIIKEVKPTSHSLITSKECEALSTMLYSKGTKKGY